ncbi:CheB methylesterase domain-containing protein [Oribacterium sinus]|uniref:CheB methylesterase domain-containing protein n=2 Tax=Oribacterium sinus TaxID=237576 RepID=UPI0028D0E51C|nr:CheB methylesterase domain-containing protein [Oribacterium sinus]
MGKKMEYQDQKQHIELIAMGASTGGTEALLAVLKELPGNLPPIVITQHMPPVFTEMYAERLNRLCAMEVREAKDGDELYSGLCLIAPGGLQMRVHKDVLGARVSCTEEEKVSGHCPSVDVLFHSVAEQYEASAIGILLTGMGKDGAKGLLAMHEQGAYTLGQDEKSSVVYGMPMEAYKLGAVSQQGNLEQIPQYLLQRLRFS